MPVTSTHTTGLKAALAALVVLLLGVLWAGLFYHLAGAQRLELDHAVETTESLNRVYAAQIQSVLSSVDQTLLLLQRLHARDGSATDAPIALAENFVLRSARARAWIVNADGWTNGLDGVPAQLGDQAYFRAHAAHDDGRMLIGVPAPSGPDGEPSLILSRRLNAPDGRFAGVVALSLNPQAINAAIVPEHRASEVARMVVGLDHVIRAVSGAVPPALGTIGQPFNAPVLFALQPTLPDAVRVATSVTDGIERVIAWRTLTDYPMLVVSAVETSRVLHDYDGHRRAEIVAAAAISVVLMLAGLWLLRVLGQREALIASLRASEERYRLTVDGSREGLFDRNHTANVSWYSARTHQLLGVPDGSLNGDRHLFLDRLHPDDRAAYERKLAAGLAARNPYNEERFRIRHADGTWRWVEVRGRVVYAADGTPVRAVGSIGDITERKTAELALREANERLLETERLGRLGSMIWDRATDRVSWSDTLFELRRVPVREFTREEGLNFIHPDDREPYIAARNAAIAERRDYVYEYRFLRPDGTIAWEHVVGRPHFDDAGEVSGIHIVVRDNTEIRETELALRRSEERYALAVEAMREGLYDRDYTTDTVWFSSRVHALLGVPDGALNGDRATFAALIHPDDRATYEALTRTWLAERRSYVSSTYRLRRSDGAWRWIVFRCSILYAADGTPTRSIGSMGDITEQRLAEEALRTRERQLAAILDNAPVAIYLKDRERRYLVVNRQHAESRGSTPEAMIGRTDEELAPEIDAQSRCTDLAVLEHGDTARLECPPAIPRPGIEQIEILKFPIVDEAGEVVGLSGFTFNVTERRRIEDQLRQAAKMEAVGRLASGIAHDFNNMIGAIVGFSSFLVEDLTRGSREHGYATRIAKVCDHARHVVRQILSFSRADQVERQLCDLREVLATDHALVRAALPPTTTLTLDPGPDPLPVEVNAGQLHQVVLNLCINASDALAGGDGTVSIRLATIGAAHPDRRRFRGAGDTASGAATTRGGRLDPARRYAALTVSDTGSGMDQATLDRVFEPFFTTKSTGLGTGLGLAVINGIVTAYDGAYHVASWRGHGSAFTIYLPLGEESADAPAEPAPGDGARGGERVLLVDDDCDMADMLAIGLERLGYAVTSCYDPHEALDLFAAEPDTWQLVITDHAMPGLRGGTLAGRLKALAPACPIILYTGLATEVSGSADGPPPVDIIVGKPIAPRRMAEHIRTLLDGAPASGRTPPMTLHTGE
ncbi:MAG: PAS domain-containing protein [Alphaproteobacteria bacterium]|nr:PAS domain-containing protein [Alphaproteobacteria bacterium]